jgi:hypothetical protein
MRSNEEQYVYNERCIQYLSTLIKSSMKVRFKTPAQNERVYRWRRARRALQHDQIQLRQTLPPDNQLHLAGWMDDAQDAQAWFQRQLRAFIAERKDNCCFEGVDPRLTPLSEGR